MESLRSDLRYAVRTLLRTRGFAVAALITLALGIGANTAIFSVVNAVLLRPLPYADADRIMVLWLRNLPEGIEEDITSYPMFTDWRQRNASFASMSAYRGLNLNLTAAGDPEQIRGAQVTGDFFQVLGTGPAIGRTFLPEEFFAGRSDVVVLSHRLWQRRFGGDASILGRTIPLSGTQYEVVGVMPSGFGLPSDAELWTPLAAGGPLQQTMESRGALWLAVIGRLRDGVTPERAQTDMSAVAAALEEEYPAQQGYGVNVEPLRDELFGNVRPALLVLLGAVGFVLLIACANVANLLLARGATRQREILIRLAMGAERGRVMRQLLTESIVLSLLGGAAGVLIAVWAVRLLGSALPPQLPRIEEITLDTTVIAFAAAVSLLTGIVFGLAPALQAGRTDLTSTLREGGRGATGSALLGRLRPVLVATEVALSLVLLTGAGLMLRSFVALQGVDTGFATENRLVFRIALPSSRYADGAAAEQMFVPFLERIRNLPGVESAAGVSTLLLSRLPNMSPITVEGQPPAAPDAPRISVTTDAILGDFLGTMDMQLVRGRTFLPSDDGNAPTVAIVNEAFVRTFMPDDDPVGRRFTFGSGQPGDDGQIPWITIVGVMADTKRSGVAEAVRPEMFFNYAQSRRGNMQFVVRTLGPETAVIPEIRQVLRDADPELPMAQLSSVEDLIGEGVATRRFVMQLLTLFSALAAVLTAIGIYGVIAYLVSQRTREIGIRMSVGAARLDVFALVLADAARYVIPGLIAGTVAALALTRLLRSQLFGVGPTDPLTFAGVAALFVLISFLASVVPAHRAARTDPMEALRSEV